jgi:hypothetical protein
MEVSAGALTFASTGKFSPLTMKMSVIFKLRVGDTLLVLAKVVTCDPQVGNGQFEFQHIPNDTMIYFRIAVDENVAEGDNALIFADLRGRCGLAQRLRWGVENSSKK